MDPFVGQIALFGFNFAPAGWAICDGSLLPISQNDALFALIGTTYGGDGQTNFALPDLRGRIPVHQGQGPGLGNWTMGERAGSETVTLTQGQMPSHGHALVASAANPAAGATAIPGPSVMLASGGTAVTPYAPAGGSATGLSASSVSVAGGSQPHDNMMPTLVANYCISLFGVFPSPS